MQTISPQDFPEDELLRFGAVMLSIGRLMSLRDPILGTAATRAESEFSPSQIHALMWCGTDGKLTMGELARRSNVTEKTITGIVDRLEHAGLLERQRDPDDRRVIHVALTPKGRVQYKTLEQAMRLRFTSFLQLLDPPDRQSLYGILEKVRDRITEQAAAGKPKP